LVDRGKTGWRLWVKRLAPWVITGLILAALLYKYPIGKITDQVRQGNWPPLAFYGIGLAVLTLLVVSLADKIVIARSLGPIPYLTVLAGKGGSSLLALLGYSFGQGAYGVWMVRKTDCEVRKGFGTVLYIMGSDLTALAVIATVTIHAGDAELPGSSADVLGIVAPVIAAVQLILCLGGPFGLRRMKNPPRFLKPWADIKALPYLANLALRVGLISTAVVGTWAAANAFGMPIPLQAMATYMPVIMLIGALPINVGGFGAVQAAWLVFDPWAPGEQILAFQFVWHLMVGVGLVVRGSPFVRGVYRDITDGGDEESAVDSAVE
jgi:hypothetical protein